MSKFSQTSPRDLYSDVDPKNPVALAERHDTFKSAMADALSRPIVAGSRGREIAQLLGEKTDIISKSLDPSTLRSLQGALEKDLEISGPSGTGGLHQYDLEAPAKNLVPKKTPIRNRVVRERGVGTAKEFKRVTGFTGSGTAGVGLFHPGLGETETNTFGSLALRRGKKIEYAGDHVTVPYRTFSVSDYVTWHAQQASMGFQDILQLSSESTLYSAMLLEERMLLSGRGTASGFSGALATPSAPTVTTPAASGSQTAVTGAGANIYVQITATTASGSQTAVTGAGANIYVQITATTAWGETALSSVGNSAFTAGDVVVVSWTAVPGAESYNVFIGTGSSAPATSAMWLTGSTGGNSLTIQGALVTAGRAASTVNVSNTPTAHEAGYDGIIATLLKPGNAGSVTYVNGPLVSESVFQDAFSGMFDLNQASPETILCNGHDRRVLSDLLKDSTSSNYQITIPNGNEASLGALATAVQNEVTGDMVDLEVHPFMPRGIMPLMTWTLPLPGSNVSNCWAVVNVADYQGVTWPTIELATSFSVTWMGTFVAYAPVFSGIVAGITA